MDVPAGSMVGSLVGGWVGWLVGWVGLGSVGLGWLLGWSLSTVVEQTSGNMVGYE